MRSRSAAGTRRAVRAGRSRPGRGGRGAAGGQDAGRARVDRRRWRTTRRGRCSSGAWSGKRESEVAALLEYELRRGDARRTRSRRSPRRGEPEPPLRADGRGDRARHAVLIDFGVELDGFCSDGTRTFATGGQRGRRRRRVYRDSLGSTSCGVRALRPSGSAVRATETAVSGTRRRAAAVRDRRRRPRRALRPRARARRGDEDPRGAAADAALRAGARARATWRRSSRRLPRRQVRRADRGPRRGDEDGHTNFSSLPKELTVVD